MTDPQGADNRSAFEYALDGVRLLNAADYDGAISACTKAIESDPSSVGARRTRSDAYWRLGRLDEAAADLRYVRTQPVISNEEGDPRPRFNARLAQIGTRARPAGKKIRIAGNSGIWGEEWLIDIEEGPIGQVLISNHPESAKGEPPRNYIRKIEYLIPDSRVGPHISRRGVHRVTAISEEGFDVLPITSLDFYFFADLERGCWVLTEGVWEEMSTEIPQWTGSLEERPPDLVDVVARHAPSRIQWERYQNIANQVLAAPVLFAYLVGRDPAEEVCAELSDLGVTARAMEEGPFPEKSGLRWVQPGVNPYGDIQLKMSGLRWVQPGVNPYGDFACDSHTEAPRWIQIADGPIQWVELGVGTLEDKADWKDTAFLTGENIGFGTLCYIPDPRITPNLGRVRMVSDRVKSFPVFGRIKRVRWDYGKSLSAGFEGPGRIQKDKDFSKILSENLGQNLAVTEVIKAIGADLCVVSDPERGCWILATDDRQMTQWTRAMWNSCEVVAEALLTMTLPSVE